MFNVKKAKGQTATNMSYFRIHFDFGLLPAVSYRDILSVS